MELDKAAEPVLVANYVEMESEGKQKDMKSKFSKFLWHGGSVYDAWFSCASNQVTHIYTYMYIYTYPLAFLCKIFMNND